MVSVKAAGETGSATLKQSGAGIQPVEFCHALSARP